MQAKANTTEEGTLLYRYDIYDSYEPVRLQLAVFKVTSSTPCGYWITHAESMWYSDQHRWMNKTAFRRYAWSTKKQALISFISRKKKQISIVENQLSKARLALKEAIKVLDESENKTCSNVV